MFPYMMPGCSGPRGISRLPKRMDLVYPVFAERGYRLGRYDKDWCEEYLQEVGSFRLN